MSYRRYRILFNPFILTLQIPLLFLVVPQIIFILVMDGEDSFLSDTVIFAFVTANYIGCLIKVPFIKIPNFKNIALIKTSLYIIGAACAIPLIPMLLSYGISFRGLRQFYEEVVFSQYSSFYAILKIILTCLIILNFIRIRKINKEIFILSIILLFSGSKMAMLSTFIVFAALWEQYKKINYKKLTYIALIMAIGMIGYHSAQNTNDKVDAMKGALSYFDVYNQQSKALTMLVDGDIDYYYGELYFSSFYKIIPRFLWQDKPKDFGFALLNYKIYPEYSADGYMPSFGLAYTFADFGFFSIIFMGILGGLFKNLWYKEFLHNHKNIPSFIIYILDLDIVTYFIITIGYLLSYLKNDSQNNSPLLAKR